MRRQKTGWNQDDVVNEPSSQQAEVQLDMLRELERCLQDKNVVKRFQLPVEHAAAPEELDKVSCGLPSDCSVKPHNCFLVIKPQIALRSEVDENAIVLLAVPSPMS